MSELRPYQTECISATITSLERGPSALIVLPTGTGKTVVFCALAQHFAKAGKRVLIVAHREELIQQAVEKVQHWTNLPVGIERAEDRAVRQTSLAEPGWAHATQPIVVASIQSLSRQSRLKSFSPDDFGLVIIDEAHHAMAASYRKMLAHFSAAKHLGVTATPDRGDKVGLGAVFGELAYEYGFEQAISDGWLVPVREAYVEVDGLDYSKVHTMAGDLSEKEVAAILENEAMLHAMASPIADIAGTRPTLTFTPSVAHAHAMAGILCGYHKVGRTGLAVALDGSTPREVRAQTLRDFKAGKFQHLVGCALFLEGFDEPSIACIAMCRPTKVRTVYAQAVGRGTRPHPGKTDLLVIDFAGNAGKHKLVRATDLFSTPDDDVRKAMEEIAELNPDLVLTEVRAQAEHKVEEERERERQRQEALAKAKRDRPPVHIEVAYRKFFLDMHEVLGVRETPAQPGEEMATNKQLQCLANFHVPNFSGKLTKRQASLMIDTLISRANRGLCTVKQARKLKQYGYNPDSTFEQARIILDKLATNGWRR